MSRAFNVEPHNGSKRSDAEPDGTRLLERIEALEAMLNREREVSADLKEDRDRWRAQATGLLTDLRAAKENTNNFNNENTSSNTLGNLFKPIPERPWLWRILRKPPPKQ